MDVFHEQHDGSLRREPGQERDPALVQPVTGREWVHVAGQVEAQRQAEDLASSEASQRHLGRIAVEDPEVFLQHFPEWPVGDAFSVGEATSCPAQRLRLFGCESLPERTRETRLADPCVAEDGHERGARRLQRSAVRVEDALQLGVSPHEHGRETAHAARSHQGEGAQNAATGDGSRLPLRVDLVRLGELECSPRGRDGAVSHEDLAGPCCLFQACGDIDRIAADERASFASAADDDVAGVDADPKLRPFVEEPLVPPLHRERGVQRALGVVLERFRRPEHGHHGIACEFLDRSARGLDLR